MRISALEEINRLDAAQTKRLENYTDNLSTDRDKVLFDKNVLEVLKSYSNLDEMDEVLDYLKSINYSSANYSYSMIEDQLLRFTEENHKDFRWNQHYKAQKAEMIAEFNSWRLSQVEYRVDDDIRNVLPKKDTHAGFEFVVTGKRKKGEYLEDGVVRQYLEQEEFARQNGSFNNIILAGTRTQASGAFNHDEDYAFTGTYKKKSRLVSMVRLWLILAESKFAKPLQSKLGHTLWYAGGKDDAAIMSRIMTMKSKKRYSLTLDYSHYDQSISDWLIRDAFDIMEAAFTHVNFDRELFHIIREDMVRKYFIDGNGRIRESRKGVCSGSMFTQLVDSIVNKLMIGTYMKSKKLEHECLIMGDDNLIYTDVKLDREDVCSYLMYNFGIEANPAKCSEATVKEAPEFLSRYWTIDGVWRHPYELLSKVCYPEKFRDYAKGADAIMIIYAYCLSFPLGMRKLIRYEDFMQDYTPKEELLRDSGKRKYLSGLMQYRLDHGI